MWGPFVRERFRQLRHPALARGIAGNGDSALERKHRRDEDDLAAAALDHPPAELACEHERRSQVHLEHAVPQIVSMLGRRLALDRPGVQQEDVDLRELLEKLIDGTAVGEVATEVAAGRADADDLRACRRERTRSRCADSAARTRDERRLTGEIELHARQSTRTLMSLAPRASSSKTEGSRSSGSTRLINRSRGSVPAATSSMARS